MPDKSPVPVESWDPFRELDLFRGWPGLRMLGGTGPGSLTASARWSPSMDVTETDTHFITTVELAGAKKEDVHVEVEDGVLTIRGEKRSERQEEKEQRRYTERSYGSFARSFTLPSNANEDDIKASFDDGVLKVEIGKREDAKSRAVQIE